MNKYIPKIYKSSIYDINYEKLKEKNIKCILFDLDNTIMLIDEIKPSSKVIKLVNDLKKDFKIIVISNNREKRIKPICKLLNIDFISTALKPFAYGFKKATNLLPYDKKEMCIIGDQLMTDILGGNRYGIMTILIDPLGKKDLKITSINRFFENIVLNRLKKQKLLERGKYYE